MGRTLVHLLVGYRIVRHFIEPYLPSGDKYGVEHSPHIIFNDRDYKEYSHGNHWHLGSEEKQWKVMENEMEGNRYIYIAINMQTGCASKTQIALDGYTAEEIARHITATQAEVFKLLNSRGIPDGAIHPGVYTLVEFV
jgi:hypothetical protein